MNTVPQKATPHCRLSDALEDLLERLYLLLGESCGILRQETYALIAEIGGQPDEMLIELHRLGMIDISAFDTISLTPTGLERAKAVLFRHQTLRDFFVEVLGVAPEAADSGACRIEHVISDEILESMIHYTRAVRDAGQSASDALHADKKQKPSTVRKSQPAVRFRSKKF